MAGIGFELKKLFVGSGVIRKMRAYAYAAVICSGTMILAILLLLAVQAEARFFGISEHMREVLVVTMVYALFLSMLLSSGFQMYLSRYVANMMYQNQMDKVLPSLIGAALTLMIPGGILYGYAVSTAAELTLFQKILNWLLFTELIPVWLLMAYITAAKDYRAILIRFLAGVLTAILGGPLLCWIGVSPMTALMLALAVGYGVMLTGMLRVLLKYFPSGRCSLLGYVAWFSRTPDLLLTGFLSMAGAFVHIVLMWFSPLGSPVTGIFRQAPLFDSAAFYAYLVTVPTNINFIVSVEVNFYAAYRRYFTAVTDGGTMPEIRLARKQMERSMWQEINNLIVVQIFAMVLYMLFMRYFLSAIGFTADMLHMFRLMCIGYSLYCIGISLMMLQLYFNDRGGAMASAAAFFVFNAAGTLVSLRFGTLFYGAGVIAGGLAMYLVSFPRLNRHVKRIDYNVYCSQPVFNEITHDFWKELAARLEARAARRRNPDADSLYAAFDSTDPVCFYVTVTGGSAADGTNHTLEEVNSYLNLQGMTGVEKIRTEIILQVGDEEGPREGEFGFGAVSGNATMNVRGRTSTGYPQKSYRISLFDGAGLWHGQKAIALNKHPADVTRIRNMLYFRLLEDVPSIPSLRTQFVHLWVRDLTAADPVDEFVDYGLFTQVELPNKRYLRNHGLSINGNLYKANMCEKYRYPDNLKPATDPGYDPALFGEVLEPKTGDDHTKLLRMLDAVNDYSVPAEELLGKYFDEDNLTSYLAFNLLMGNPDSNAQNYLLYSPIDSERWYYLCWDGDGCLKYSEYDILNDAFEEGEWTRGVSDYWGVVLFNRLLRLPTFREALSAKVEALRSVVTAERVKELVAEYRKTADLYASSSPDSAGMKVTPEVRDRILEALPGDVELSYRYYLESLEKPMPFYQGEAEAEGNTLRLRWSESYDFDGEFLRYDVTVARDWTFSDPIYEAKGLLETETTLPMPEAGEYWWRVTVTNESGHSQTSFDSVLTSTGAHQGMRRFTIQSDGSVVNPE